MIIKNKHVYGGYFADKYFFSFCKSPLNDVQVSSKEYEEYKVGDNYGKKEMVKKNNS